MYSYRNPEASPSAGPRGGRFACAWQIRCEGQLSICRPGWVDVGRPLEVVPVSARTRHPFTFTFTFAPEPVASPTGDMTSRRRRRGPKLRGDSLLTPVRWLIVSFKGDRRVQCYTIFSCRKTWNVPGFVVQVFINGASDDKEYDVCQHDKM